MSSRSRLSATLGSSSRVCARTAALSLQKKSACDQQPFGLTHPGRRVAEAEVCQSASAGAGQQAYQQRA
eukprot:3933455-Rhodomonas_salina.1